MSGKSIILDKRASVSTAGDMVQAARERMHEAGVASDSPQAMLNELVATAFAQQGMGPTTLTSLQGRVAALEIAVHSMADLRPWVEKLHNETRGRPALTDMGMRVDHLVSQVATLHAEVGKLRAKDTERPTARRTATDKGAEVDPRLQESSRIREVLGIDETGDVVAVLRARLDHAERVGWERGRMQACAEAQLAFPPPRPRRRFWW